MKTSHLELHTETLPNGPLVEAHVHGTLDGTDYDVLLPELNALLAKGKPLSFLLFMEKFHGWDIEAFVRELKWGGEHRKLMRKVAVVGEAAWQKWATLLSQTVMGGAVRYFSLDEADQARVWAHAVD